MHTRRGEGDALAVDADGRALDLDTVLTALVGLGTVLVPNTLADELQVLMTPLSVVFIPSRLRFLTFDKLKSDFAATLAARSSARAISHGWRPPAPSSLRVR
jgi:hypothetical protein